MINETGLRIRSARKNAKLTQNQLAQMIGTQLTTVSLWERGETVTSAHWYPKLATALGVSLEYLHGIKTRKQR